MMAENKQGEKPGSSATVKWIKKLNGIFDWIAKGQPADALCKG
jgi:hypothetical protein